MLNFKFSALFDISKPAPAITLTNLSLVSNDEETGNPTDISGYKYNFKVTTPSGIVCYEGGSPDINGAWDDPYVIPAQIPLINGSVEWGSDGYLIEGAVTDANNAAVTSFTRNVILCRPKGYNRATGTNYGTMQMMVETRCAEAKVYVEDQTDYTYQDQPGATNYKKIRMIYPASNPDDEPKTFFNASAFGPLLIPIYYDGDGYQLLTESVRDYTTSEGVTIRVKYLFKKVFKVDCFIDLACLIRGVAAYKAFLIGKTCTMQERMNLEFINTDLALINLAKLQPLSGYDIKAAVDRIKDLLGEFYSPCPCNNGLYPSIIIPGAEMAPGSGFYKQTVRIDDADVQLDINTGIVTCDRIAGFDPANTMILKDVSFLLNSEYTFNGTFQLTSKNYTPGITLTFFGPKIPVS